MPPLGSVGTSDENKRQHPVRRSREVLRRIASPGRHAERYPIPSETRVAVCPNFESVFVLWQEGAPEGSDHPVDRLHARAHLPGD